MHVILKVYTTIYKKGTNNNNYNYKIYILHKIDCIQKIEILYNTNTNVI